MKTGERTMTQKLPHVHVVSTGGTIASRPVSPTQTTGYSQIALTGDDLVAGIPGIEQQVRLSTEQIFSVASSALKDADLLRLSQRVSETKSAGKRALSKKSHLICR